MAFMKHKPMQAIAAEKVEYLGESDGSTAKDLTIGNTYELDGSFVSVTGKFVKIYRDDVGDPHDVYAHTVRTKLDDRPLTNKPVFGAQYNKDPVPVAPMPDIDDDWEEDEANDAFASGTDLSKYHVPDVEPVPDGPKSTDDLRKYRFKPDIF